MIHYNTQIQYMDVKKADAWTKDIGDMFGEYFVKAVIEDDGITRYFDGDLVKLTDWRGWSDIKKIIRLKCSKWVHIYTKLNKEIHCCPEQYIPVYNPSEVSQGFHGETKYSYRLTKFKDLKEGDMIRIRNGLDGDTMMDFDEIREVTIDVCTDEKFIDIGYSVFTKSGFFNANDIYLWNGEKAPSNPCEEVNECEGHHDHAKCTGCKYMKKDMTNAVINGKPIFAEDILQKMEDSINSQ